MRTPFTDLLRRTLPLAQAPMAGVSTVAMAGAVSRAGGLGALAVGAMTAADADAAIAAAMAAGDGMLNVNVFAHAAPERDPARESAWIEVLKRAFDAAGAAPPASLTEPYRRFDDDPEMLDVLLARRPPVVSFHFGLPDPRRIAALRQAGTVLFATATTAEEARRIEAAGIDIVVAQGYEAGGHRGCFDPQAPDQQYSTLALVPRIVHAVDIPVLAAGGITTGAGIAAALRLGAAGAQLGSAFIDCEESAASQTHRRALTAPGNATVMTRVFSGRPARAIVNDFVRTFRHREAAAPAYPVAYDAAKRLAAASGSAEFSAMWAGQGAIRHSGLTAAALVRILGEELMTTATDPGTRSAER